MVVNEGQSVFDVLVVSGLQGVLLMLSPSSVVLLGAGELMGEDPACGSAFTNHTGAVSTFSAILLLRLPS